MARTKIPQSQYFTECLAFLAVLKSNGSDDMCMIWPFSKRKGYGQVWIDGHGTRTHTEAYIRTSGPLPEGHGTLHSCDNPPCFNPDHLRSGTQHDNVSVDGVERARYPRGLHHHKGKLPPEHVVEIKRLYWKSSHLSGRHCRSEDYSQSQLAATFGISREHVRQIVNGKSRKYC